MAGIEIPRRSCVWLQRPKVKLGFRPTAGVCGGMASQEIVVDARGHRCPVPTLLLRKAFEAAPAGGRVRLLADDPMARIDVPHFAAEVGAEILVREDAAGGGFSFLVAKP
jgi:tRNA 2-thiouridine synthesizing protein A